MNINLFGGVERKGLEGVDREKNGMIASNPCVDFILKISFSM